MTTEREQHLLERCLRLEAELLLARGIAIPPPLPQVARRGLYAAPLSSPLRIALGTARKIYHVATEAEIAQMRELRRQGLSYSAIGRELSFTGTTVRDHARDVIVEQEREAA